MDGNTAEREQDAMMDMGLEKGRIEDWMHTVVLEQVEVQEALSGPSFGVE